MNKRVTKRERGLLKGAIRRVFSRSELRKAAIDLTRIEHTDPSRPRVRKWSRCPLCKLPTATYEMAVDHIQPIVPVTTSFEDMSLDTVVDRTWCELKGLQALCSPCHDSKTKQENAQRRANKKRKKTK